MRDRFYTGDFGFLKGDFVQTYPDADSTFTALRHSERPEFAGRWATETTKPALDDGKPARLVRVFPTVTDDFGNLVEV